jgi:hypothetical protein
MWRIVFTGIPVSRAALGGVIHREGEVVSAHRGAPIMASATLWFTISPMNSARHVTIMVARLPEDVNPSLGFVRLELGAICLWND